MEGPYPRVNEAKDAEEILGLLFLADLATLVQLKRTDLLTYQNGIKQKDVNGRLDGI